MDNILGILSLPAAEDGGLVRVGSGLYNGEKVGASVCREGGMYSVGRYVGTGRGTNGAVSKKLGGVDIVELLILFSVRDMGGLLLLLYPALVGGARGGRWNIGRNGCLVGNGDGVSSSGWASSWQGKV